MSLLQIVKFPHPSLARKAIPITNINGDIISLLDNMAETMYFNRGVGLAAPQVNQSVRIVVVDIGTKLHSLINPEIIFRKGIIKEKEGCLSLPGLFEILDRNEEIAISYLDREGAEQTLDASGLLSVCLQHELDHLDAIMMLDRMSRLKRKLAMKSLLQ